MVSMINQIGGQYYQPNEYFSRKKQATARNSMNTILVTLFEVFLLLIFFCKSLTNSFIRIKIMIMARIKVMNLSLVIVIL